MKQPVSWPEEIDSLSKIVKEWNKIGEKHVKPIIIELVRKNLYKTNLEYQLLYADKTNELFCERFGIEYGFERRK